MMSHPPHPGEVLKNQYIKPLGLSVTQVAEALVVSRKNLSEVINGHTGISPEMALRVAKAFGTHPELWTDMQSQYELWQAEQKNVVQDVRQLYQTNTKAGSN